MRFFKNYFYGRPGQRDFTEQDLPTNRFQLFREVLKVRRGNMVGLNFLYLLCWIPAALWSFVNLVQLSAIAGASATQRRAICCTPICWCCFR